ncbi:sigma-54-dependent Fis family transcriptional regulator [Geotalea uraniireducens]|uniref:Sigma-54-dependent Fis family transcriptional regulator n=1 Tax=Geotalea uraniireducens TaxID=351604 RepID=A0ABM8EKW1_9BACT|nr:PEP-CTERM-box response regulator transcription factor [Geotalea uraniireducens]BDV43073.1 sigma-54-dependent Fis family transcriptional regulator [Geotalea uraniireducens]
MEKLLIVDDNEDIRRQLRWGIGNDYALLLAADGREALDIFRKQQPGVVMLDLGLPPHEDSSEEGFRCLEEMLRIAPDTKIIVITGNEGRSNAVKAVQLGAYDFYQKPIDLNELKVIIKRAFHLQVLEEENRRLQSALNEYDGEFKGFIGDCPEMGVVFSTIRKVAPSDVSVLVTGESGTGKELVARAIHGMSLRKNGPFVPINCGAIPENLLEAELFGHEKGAFTGALNRVLGKVEYAHKGTLFLDEIGELSLPLQVKLLRFLQEKVIQRVGGREDIPVDVRIVAASNVDISQAMETGQFREDLYYRIGVVTVLLPPLRNRGDDLMQLANYFLKRFTGEFKKKIKGYSPTAREYMEAYGWPGNVRELENKVQRAVLMATAPLIEPDDLGFTERPLGNKLTALENMTLREARDRVEREMIKGAIANNKGNIAKAAEELAVSRPTLYDLIRKHGINC